MARGMLRQLSVPLSGNDFSAACLVLTELVTNVIRHGCSSEDDEMEVDIYRSEGSLEMHVTQPGPLYDPDLIPRRKAGEGGGWGLLLLDRLCSGWGVDAGASQAWAELTVDP